MGQVSTRYTWGDDSAVEKVDFTVSSDGSRKNAIIFAGSNVERGGLAKIPSALTRYGFSNIYAEVIDGKNALVIEGVGDENKVLAALANLAVTRGESQRESFETDVTKGKKSDWLRRNALNVNGVFGTMGHAAMAGTGVLQNDKDRMWNGILGGMVPLMLGICGNGKHDLDFDPVFDGMRQYFSAEGLQLPVFTEQHKSSLADVVKNFVSSHPVPIAYSIGMVAGYKGLKSAYNQVSKGQGGMARLAAVGSSQVGNLVVLGVPEKEKNALDHEEHKDRSIGGEITDHFKAFAQDPVGAVRAAPMFWDGALKFLDNILYGIDTKEEITKVSKIWAGNRETDEYKRLAQEITQKLSKLGIEVEDIGQLANVVVPSGRPSGKFGQLIAGLEKEQEVLSALKVPHGFGKRNAVVQALDQAGLSAEENKAMFKDMETFSRMEEEYRIATSGLGKHSPWLAGITAATFTIATAMETLASKNRDKSFMQEEAYNKLFALAARSVCDIEPEDRAFMVHKMAVYLSGQSDIHNAGITSERISQEITSRVNAIDDSPWIAHMSSHAQQALRTPTSAEQAAQEHAHGV